MQVPIIIGTVTAILLEALALGALTEANQGESGLKATVGAYYFDGWSGRNTHAGDPQEPWATTAPTHLTRRMIEEFPEREPTWGWRDDSLAIMERQIDLAADHGVIPGRNRAVGGWFHLLQIALSMADPSLRGAPHSLGC